MNDRKIAVLMLVGVTVLMGIATSACAPGGYYNWKNAANYPARVKAVHFSNTLDANNCAKFSSWTFCFTKHSDIYIAASLGYTDDRSTMRRYGHEKIGNC